MKALFISLALAGVAGIASGQPVISPGGILNSASYGLSVLQNGPIAQGSLFTVFGSGLGPSTLVQAKSFPLPTTAGLGGTSITITSGATTLTAPMLFTISGQVAGILPSDTPVGTANMTVTFNGQTSAPMSFTVAASAFGIYTLNAGGSGPGAVQIYPSFSTDNLTTVAKPGDTMILYGTGLGPISGDETVAPPVKDLRSSVDIEVWVGNKQATVSYAGRNGCCAGLDQVNFVVPSGMQGCYVSVAVKAGSIVSNFSSIAVDPSASVCNDPNGYSAADLTTAAANKSFRLGAVNLSRSALTIVTGDQMVGPLYSDIGTGLFGNYSLTSLNSSLGVIQSPSIGSCTVATFHGLDPTPIDPIVPSPLLDAGSALAVTGPVGAGSIPETSKGIYYSVLGGSALDQLITGGGTLLPAYLEPGAYTVKGNGGPDVGSFSASINIAATSTWTNSASLTTVPRTQDLKITWTGGDPTTAVAITGISSSAATYTDLNSGTPGVAFLCLAPVSAQSFTVPSVVLQTLPPTSATSAIPLSFLLLGNTSAPVKFTATGIDAGYLGYRVLTGQNVTFQ